MNVISLLRRSPTTSLIRLPCSHSTSQRLHTLSPGRAGFASHPQHYTPRTSARAFLPCRSYSTSQSVSAETESTSVDSPMPISTYRGPLARTFRSLKIFSLSSLALASSLVPFMFIIESSLPFVARVSLAATAMMTSGVSTALVSWCGKPYVLSLKRFGGADGSDGAKDSSDSQSAPSGLELETSTLWMKPLFTRVYDTSFLVDTTRPFAKWELAKELTMTGTQLAGEETIAETRDARGNVVGRWIVDWNPADGGGAVVGTCREVGNIVRHFNVHPELLPPSLQR